MNVFINIRNKMLKVALCVLNINQILTAFLCHNNNVATHIRCLELTHCVFYAHCDKHVHVCVSLFQLYTGGQLT